jgi:hypothetical protein
VLSGNGISSSKRELGQNIYGDMSVTSGDKVLPTPQPRTGLLGLKQEIIPLTSIQREGKECMKLKIFPTICLHDVVLN